MWTGLPVEESIRMTEDRDKWRKYVHDVANLLSRMAEEQNRTEYLRHQKTRIPELFTV